MYLLTDVVSVYNTITIKIQYEGKLMRVILYNEEYFSKMYVFEFWKAKKDLYDKMLNTYINVFLI